MSLDFSPSVAKTLSYPPKCCRCYDTTKRNTQQANTKRQNFVNLAPKKRIIIAPLRAAPATAITAPPLPSQSQCRHHRASTATTIISDRDRDATMSDRDGDGDADASMTCWGPIKRKGVDPLIPGHGWTIPRSVSCTRQHHLNVAQEPSQLS